MAPYISDSPDARTRPHTLAAKRSASEVEKRVPRTFSSQDPSGAGMSLLLLVAVLVMPLEQVLAEIAGEVTPHRVDVVGIVLGVIEFDQE
jgi:hypothetical protein